MLIAQRGRLGCDPSSGAPVYAAAFLRDRKIILEAALLSDSQGFRLILMHELFHFVWMHLGNSARAEFADVLLKEWKHGARGELGESSAVRKELLREGAVTGNAKPWRDYVCESFCDTAGWLYADAGDNDLFTLRKRWREGRKAWFEAAAKRGVWNC